jgi:hypothetical protein
MRLQRLNPPGLDGYAAAMTNVRMIANSVRTTDETIKKNEPPRRKRTGYLLMGYSILTLQAAGN